jgi:hypothetical protein
VTIPATVPQGSEIPEVLMNNPVYNGPTKALVRNKTLIHMSHTKILKITPTYFDHQLIIIKKLFDPG